MRVSKSTVSRQRNTTGGLRFPYHPARRSDSRIDEVSGRSRLKKRRQAGALDFEKCRTRLKPSQRRASNRPSKSILVSTLKARAWRLLARFAQTYSFGNCDRGVFRSVRIA